MTFENEIFNKISIDYDKLLKYGFIIEHDYYKYTCNILNDSFVLIITIRDKNVSTSLIDLDTKEEYRLYHNESLGTYASMIKKEVEKVLFDISFKCGKASLFRFSQSNRIVELIKKKYGDDPLFLWDDSDAAVFKNEDSNKWYGIIMAVKEDKLKKNGNNELVDVMNVKLDPNLINELVDNYHYFKAYHMNKKYWISIILNDVNDDNELMDLIEMSHKYTVIGK